MRLVLFLLWGVYLCADITTSPYIKDILISDSNTKLIKVKLDNEIYKYSHKNFRDIRLVMDSKELGYFIQKENYKIQNNRYLRPTFYNREDTSVTFILDKPFEVQDIFLDIEDSNFESIFSLYIDNKLIKSNIKIFDFSKETGNQNFRIKVNQKVIQKITLKYDLNKTQFFHHKYKNIQKASQYLSLKTITLTHNQKNQTEYDYTNITHQLISSKDKISTHIFNTQNLQIDSFELFSDTKNYKRICTIYKSKDKEQWYKIGNFTLSNNSFNNQKSIIKLNTRTKYLKLDIHDGDNQPLNIGVLKIGTIASYLFFIPEHNKQFQLYFGNINAKNARYDIENFIIKTDIATIGKLSKMYDNQIYQPIEKPKIPFLERYKDLILTVFILFSILILTFIAFKLFKNKEF